MSIFQVNLKHSLQTLNCNLTREKKKKKKSVSQEKYNFTNSFINHKTVWVGRNHKDHLFPTPLT